MRIGFNIPTTVETIEIIMKDNNGKEVKSEFTRTVLEQLKDDRERGSFINTIVGREWPNPKKKKWRPMKTDKMFTAMNPPVEDDKKEEDDGK